MTAGSRVSWKQMVTVVAVVVVGTVVWGHAAHIGVSSERITVAGSDGPELPIVIDITSPLEGASHNIASYEAGCSTSEGDICGTATGGTGITDVGLSIRRVGGNYWDGTGFTSATEVLITPVGLESWNLAFPASDFPATDSYVVTAYAEDSSSSVASTSATFSIDPIVPGTPTITVNPASPTTSADPSFEFTGDADATFECELDGGGFTPCTSPKTYSSLADGSHTFKVRAVDAAGNISGESSHTWIVDAVPGTIAIDFPVDGASYNTAGYRAGCGTTTIDDICGTAANEGTGVSQVRLSFRHSSGFYWNGSSYSGTTEEVLLTPTGTTSWVYTLAAGALPIDGVWTVRAVVTDGMGRTTSTTSTFTYDNAAPATPTLTANPANPTTSADASFSYTSDAGTTFECQLDGSGFASCPSSKDYTALADGSHTFQVRALDAAGNVSGTRTYTWTLDAVPPTVAIDFPVDGSIYGAVAYDEGCATTSIGDICGTAANDGTAISVKVSIQQGSGNYWNGTGFTSGTEVQLTATGTTSWSYDLAAAAFPDRGAYTLRTYVTDGIGRTVSSSSTFTVDFPPPPTITVSPASPTISTDASFSFTHPDALATFECQLDGGDFTPCTSPQAYSLLADGSHTFRVRAIDVTGEVSAAASHTWIVDAVPGEVAITFPVDGASYNQTGYRAGCGTATTTDTCGTTSNPGTGVSQVRLSFRHSSGFYWNGSSYSGTTEVLLTPTGTTSWIYNLTASALPVDGVYTVRAVVTDGMGRTTSTTSTFTYDTAAPATPTLTANPTNPTTSADASFSFTSDAGATFECQLDGSGFAACPSPKDYLALADGSHTFQVRALDAAGNTSGTRSYTWTVDAVAPTVGITFPVDGITYNAADYDAGCGSATTGDICGTAANDGTAISVKVSIQQGTGNYWNGTGFGSATEVQITPTGTTSWFYNLAAAAFPGSGSYTLRSYVTDGMGRTVSTSSTFTIGFPAAPTLTDKPTNPSTNTDPSFSFTSDAGVTFECELDGVGFTPCTSPQAYSSLADGSHTFKVRAIDGDGDVSPETSYTWMLDAVPGTIAIDFPVDGSSYNGAGYRAGCGTTTIGDICGTASNAGTGISTVRVSIRRLSTGGYWNGSSFGSATEVLLAPTGTTSWVFNLFSTSLPSDGSYTIRAVVTDGMSRTTSTSSTFIYDNAAPATPTLTANPTNPTTSADASFSYTSDAGTTFECQLDGSGFASCPSPKDYLGLADGSHTFQVRAIDAAGNVSGTRTYTWTVDAVQGTVTNTFPVEGTSYNLSAYNAGCSTASTGDVCGTSANAGTGISEVKVSIQQGSGNYWDGTGFGSSTEVQLTATGTTSWSHNLAASAFPARGAYTLRAYATDGVGRTVSTATTFTIDFPPAPVLTDKPANPSITADPSFSFTGEAGATFECELDGGGFSTCTSPQSYTSLAEGSHTFKVRAIDAGANISPETSYTWTVDAIAPTVAITFPVEGTTYTAAGYRAGCGTSFTSDVCGTAANAGTGISAVKVSMRQGSGNYWDGSSFSSATEVLFTATGTTSWSYGLLSTAFTSGNYTLRAEATDGVGRTVSGSTTFTMDVTAPFAADIQTTNNSGGTAGRIEQGDTITFTYSEAMNPSSFFAGWDGQATNVTVEAGNAFPDTIRIINSAETAYLPFGTVSLGSSSYVSATVYFGLQSSSARSTMVMSGNDIIITLGAASSTNVATVASNTTMSWAPSTTPTDLAGNACLSTSRTEGGTADFDF